MKIRIFLVLLAGCILAFCMGSRVEPKEIINESDVKSVVEANNQFCFKLYHNLREKELGNIFFSPFSITMAMAIVFEGARGWVAEEMVDVFKFPVEPEIRRRSFRTLYQSLNKEDAKCKLNLANALWIQKDYPILSDYLKAIKEYYSGNATNVDFINATERARQMINAWVEEKTNNRIKNLFPPGSLNSNSRLVVTNAIYFKGNWQKQFDKKLTIEEDFYVSETKIIKVPMMRRTDPEAIFNYADTDLLQILEIPYEGNDLSMIILLPKDRSVSDLENKLNKDNLEEWKKQLSKQRVNVYIPRFTFEIRYELTTNLSELGMPNAFAPHCDLSGIDGTKNLYIQSVIHKAFVEVNEEGTEAAAATGVAVGITAVRPQIPVFRADHPFAFLIQERSTGNILFIGRIVEPKS